MYNWVHRDCMWLSHHTDCMRLSLGGGVTDIILGKVTRRRREKFFAGEVMEPHFVLQKRDRRHSIRLLF